MTNMYVNYESLEVKRQKEELTNNTKTTSTSIVRGVAGATSRSITRAGSLCDTAPNRKCGFTLAEVLITLGIIGVVAAVTLPSLIINVNKRVNAEQARSAKYKFTKATDKMKSLGLIGPYASTEAFVNELKKHLKIAKICPSTSIEGCWPTKEVKLDDDDHIYEIKNATTGKSLKMPNDKDNDYTSNNIGIVTADGTPMIISYNKNCQPLEPEKTYSWTTDGGKPVSNASAGCVAAVMDINGSKKPNKLSEDVVLFNARGLGAECGIELGGKCFALLSSIKPMTNSECEAAVAEGKLGIKGCIKDTYYGESDYWAGAVKECGGVSKMAGATDLKKIAQLIYGDNFTDGSWGNSYNGSAASKLGLPSEVSDSSDNYFFIWSNEEYGDNFAYFRVYFSTYTRYDRSYYSSGRGFNGRHYAICLVE